MPRFRTGLDALSLTSPAAQALLPHYRGETNRSSSAPVFGTRSILGGRPPEHPRSAGLRASLSYELDHCTASSFTSGRLSHFPKRFLHDPQVPGIVIGALSIHIGLCKTSHCPHQSVYNVIVLVSWCEVLCLDLPWLINLRIPKRLPLGPG